MQYRSKILAVLACFACAGSVSFAQQKTVDLEHLNYTVEPDTDWTNLFIRTSGWFGADGIYTIPLDGARSKGGRRSAKNMIIFSDSMIGEIQDGKLQPGDKWCTIPWPISTVMIRCKPILPSIGL